MKKNHFPVIAIFATFTFLASSCSKESQNVSSESPKTNISAHSKDMSRLWNPIEEECIGDPNHDCVALERKVWIEPYGDVSVKFNDIFTDANWNFGTNTSYDQSQLDYITTEFSISENDLNALGGYGFFNLLYPDALTETEFDEVLTDYSVDIFTDATDQRVNVTFTPTSAAATFWALEAEFDLVIP